MPSAKAIDVATVAKVKADLKGWQLTHCLFVGDACMVSAANFRALARGEWIAENLQVKEVVIGEGERRRRYAVCFNPQEAGCQQAHREQVLTELAAKLESLRPLSGVTSNCSAWSKQQSCAAFIQRLRLVCPLLPPGCNCMATPGRAAWGYLGDTHL